MYIAASVCLFLPLPSFVLGGRLIGVVPQLFVSENFFFATLLCNENQPQLNTTSQQA